MRPGSAAYQRIALVFGLTSALALRPAVVACAPTRLKCCTLQRTVASAPTWVAPQRNAAMSSSVQWTVSWVPGHQRLPVAASYAAMAPLERRVMCWKIPSMAAVVQKSFQHRGSAGCRAMWIHVLWVWWRSFKTHLCPLPWAFKVFNMHWYQAAAWTWSCCKIILNSTAPQESQMTWKRLQQHVLRTTSWPSTPRKCHWCMNWFRMSVDWSFLISERWWSRW